MYEESVSIGYILPMPVPKNADTCRCRLIGTSLIKNRPSYHAAIHVSSERAFGASGFHLNYYQSNSVIK